MRQFDTLDIEMQASSSSVSFILPGQLQVSATAYKVAGGGGVVGLLPFVKSKLNGRDKLTYFTDGYVSLESAAPAAKTRALKLLVDVVRAVQGNGFLSVGCLALLSSQAYVRENDGAVGLLYLPIDETVVPGGDLQAHREVYDLCANVLESLYGVQSPLADVRESPQYQSGDLDFLALRLDGDANRFAAIGGNEAYGQGADVARTSSIPIFELASCTPGLDVRHLITGQNTIIGRSAEMCDFSLPGYMSVSKRHCRVSRLADGTLEVSDLGSANGTYVDNREVKPGETVPLNAGSVLGMGASVNLLVVRTS